MHIRAHTITTLVYTDTLLAVANTYKIFKMKKFKETTKTSIKKCIFIKVN